MSKQKDPQRLSLLLGDIDPALLEEAYMTDSPEKLASLRSHSCPRRLIIMPRLAVAMISLALVLAMMLSVLVLLRPEPPAVEQPTGTHDTTLDSPYVDPDTIDAPWKTGKLTLTSLTYKTSNTLSTGRLSFDSLTSMDTEAAADAPAILDDPVFGTGENVSVSIMDNTKISDYMGTDLIKTRPADGEHMSCTDVYYNIYTDEIVCMSCHVLELVQGSELYTDAAMESFLEEILLDEVNLWAGGEVSEWRETYSTRLQSAKVRELFTQLKTPTLSKLGIDSFAFESHEIYVKEHIGDYEYPYVDIVEYGADPDKCLFSLCSPLTGITYGSYVLDLTTGETRRIDGQILGGESYTAHLALNQAKDVTVWGDYQKIAVTLPYLYSELQRVEDHFIPAYMGDNVIVFDVATGVGQVLVSIDGQQSSKLPATAAQVQKNVVCYKTLGGDWCFYRMDQNTLYTVTEGSFARIIQAQTGEVYAVMKQGEGYAFYELTGESGILAPVEAVEEDFDIANRYVMEDSLRVDVLTGETVSLWEGTPVASAASKDGRFLYLYFEGADHILCIDVCKTERGAINLSESFVTEAAEAGDVTYSLLLNHQEDRLLMTYCKEGLVIFDREAYLEGGPFRGNEYDALLDFYTINGEKLNFMNRKNAEACLILLAIPERMAYLERHNLWDEDTDGRTWQEIKFELADRLIDYMDVWADNAEVSISQFSGLLGDISLSELKDAYRVGIVNRDNLDFLPSFTISVKYGHDDEKRLNGFVRDTAKSLFDYFKADYTDEQLEEMKLLLHGVLDPIIVECRMTPYDRASAISSVLDEACLIATGMTYDVFMKTGGGLVDGNQVEGYMPDYTAMTNAAGGDVRFSLFKHVDGVYLSDFLAGLSFEEGEKEVTSITRIYHSFGLPYYQPASKACVLWVGYDETGNAYACIEGYYAEITPEAAESFKAVFVGMPRQDTNPYVYFH